MQKCVHLLQEVCETASHKDVNKTVIVAALSVKYTHTSKHVTLCVINFKFDKRDIIPPECQ
jgi:hypothetical protein